MGIVAHNRRPGETPLELSSIEQLDGDKPPSKRKHSHVGHQKPLKLYRKTSLAEKFHFNSYDAETPATYKTSRKMDEL